MYCWVGCVEWASKRRASEDLARALKPNHSWEMEVWESIKVVKPGKQVSEFETSRRKARTLSMKNTIMFFSPRSTC